jgi:predicted ATPase/DNA-binding SARP family transcriptional activator
MPPPLTIQLFGPLRVTVLGAPMPRVRTRSVEWLLALLTLRHGRAVQRSWVAGSLWPESGEARALQSLRDDLVRLRKALGPESGRLQSPTRDSLTLDLAGAAVDVLQFDAAIAAGDEESLRGAVALYTEPLLEGCLAEWAFTERAARAEQCLTALETLAERAQERSHHGEAIRYLRRAEALDPLRDSLPRQLMTSLAAAGDPGSAIQTYRDFRQRLQEQLAAAPDEETTRLFHEIHAAARRPTVQRRHAPTPTVEIASEHIGLPCPTPEPLPLALTSLIGREQEVAQLREALQQGRLVTLVGGGGVGKTRLALELALLAGDEIPDGAAWVELGPLADGALVLPTVAAALGLRDEGGVHDPDALKRRLVARLGEGALLLVLDNCEHLLDACAAAVQILLRRCPELRVLATSRQRLGLASEVVWRVPSLTVPGVQAFRPSGAQVLANQSDPSDPSDPSQTPEHLMLYSAVRLFVERAASVQPGFRLASAAEAAAVGQICRRLDGIPLALELAAARVTVLPVAQIAARLDDRFRLLTQGARGALPRQQTLRALIDWSHDLLTEPEQGLLRRLSVFAGGWTLEAAEAVGRGEGVDEWEVLDLLTSLVEKSLVLYEVETGGAEDRYRLLETVRQYARDRLREAGETEAVRERHRDWFVMLAEEAAPELEGGNQAAWLQRLEREHDNLRAALSWSLEPVANAPEKGLRLGGALWRFWYARGYWTEGRAHLAELLALPGADARTVARGHGLHGAGTLAWRQADYRSARALWEESLAIWRERGNKEGIAWALRGLANVAHEQAGDYRTARALADESLAIFRELGVKGGIAASLWTLGRVARAQWEYGEARVLLEEGVALFRELGDKGSIASTLNRLGAVARDQGEYEEARVLLEESLAIDRELGNRDGIANTLLGLALAAHLQGDPDRAMALLEEDEALVHGMADRWARIHPLGGLGHVVLELGDLRWATALYQESLRLRREVGDPFAIAQSLEDLAVVAVRQGLERRAARLLGAAEAQCAAISTSPPAASPPAYDRTVAAARGALGEQVFAAAWAEGRAMSLDQAAEYALGEA